MCFNECIGDCRLATALEGMGRWRNVPAPRFPAPSMQSQERVLSAGLRVQIRMFAGVLCHSPCMLPWIMQEVGSHKLLGCSICLTMCCEYFTCLPVCLQPVRCAHALYSWKMAPMVCVKCLLAHLQVYQQWVMQQTLQTYATMYCNFKLLKGQHHIFTHRKQSETTVSCHLAGLGSYNQSCLVST